MDIPSLFMIPSAVSSGKVHSVFPNSTDADFDFNRDSDATRVNSEGLIERVGYYGSEKITNGDFAQSGTPDTSTYTLGWYSNTGGVNISNGSLTLTNGSSDTDIRAYATNGVFSLNILTTNIDYKLEFDIVSNQGSTDFEYYSAAGAFIDAPLTVGRHTINIKNTSNQLFLFRNKTPNSSITLDNVSIKQINGDRARLNYEIEGGLVNTKPSLLLEPQSTNILPYSENFTQWSEFNATHTSNIITSPDGQITADKITKSGLSGNDRIRKTSISVSNSTSYAISVFVKNDTNVTGGITTLAFRVSGGTLFRQGIEWTGNIATLTDSKSNGTRTNKILENYGNGWYRVGFAFTTDGTSGVFEIDIDRENINNTTSIFVWGAVLEQQSYATSYIPTNGSTQTRAAETCLGAGTSSILPSEEGIFFVEIARISDDSYGNYELISLKAGSSDNTDNAMGIGFNISSDMFWIRFKAGGITKIEDFTTVATRNVFFKIAIKFKSGNNKIYINGIEKVANTNTFSALDLHALNFRWSTLYDFRGKLRDIRVYNTKEMTDSEVDILLTKITS